MKLKKSRFTLIEMLAVVAIASILIALITPSVQKMMFGNKVDQCASNLKLALEQAQSKAVASRKYVALVLPTDPTASGITVNMKQYCKSGYRMAYVKKDGETYKFANWIPGSDWKNPNDGAVLVNITNSFPADVSTHIDSLTPANVAGKLANLSDIDLNGASEPDFTALGSNSEKSSAIIFSPYGGIVNNDRPLYFTVTEGKYDGSSYVLGNTDNILVLKLNAITGRVTYFDPFAE